MDPKYICFVIFLASSAFRPVRAEINAGKMAVAMICNNEFFYNTLTGLDYNWIYTLPECKDPENNSIILLDNDNMYKLVTNATVRKIISGEKASESQLEIDNNFRRQVARKKMLEFELGLNRNTQILKGVLDLIITLLQETTPITRWYKKIQSDYTVCTKPLTWLTGIFTVLGSIWPQIMILINRVVGKSIASVKEVLTFGKSGAQKKKKIVQVS